MTTQLLLFREFREVLPFVRLARVVCFVATI
jgi:hypothetical protein